MEKATRRAAKRAFAVALAVLAAALSAFALYNLAERKMIYPLRYAESVDRYAAACGLDRALVYALIKTESGFDARAESAKGAKGLMQLTDGTAAFVAAALGIKEYDLFDADTNIALGCGYLCYLFGKFSEETTVLAAYNAGEGNVRSWLKDARYSSDGKTLSAVPFAETEGHVRKTMRYKEKYRKIHDL